MITEINGIPIVDFYLKNRKQIDEHEWVCVQHKRDDPTLTKYNSRDIKQAVFVKLLDERIDETEFTFEDLRQIERSLIFERGGQFLNDPLFKKVQDKTKSAFEWYHRKRLID